jgi:ribosomal protein S18 acetylase RimI-like enzyme
VLEEARGHAVERMPAPEEGVRPAGPGDIPEIVDLATIMHAELEPMRGGHIWAVREARETPLDHAYRSLLGQPDVLLVVGTIDGVIVGFGAGQVERLQDGSRLGVVSDLFVHPEARAVGVGEAMLANLVEFFTARGCVGVDAVALPGHRAAKNFFEESGFSARAIVMHHSFRPEPDGS